MRHFILMFIVFGLSVTPACGGDAPKGGEEKGDKPSDNKSNTSSPADKGGDAPAFKDPNKVTLSAQVRKGFKKPMEDFKGTFDMQSAYIGWMQGKLYLRLARGKDTCDMFKTSRRLPAHLKDQLQVTIPLVRLTEAQKKGTAPLKGAMKPRNAVIYAKGFNRMLMLHAAKASGLRFD